MKTICKWKTIRKIHSKYKRNNWATPLLFVNEENVIILDIKREIFVIYYNSFLSLAYLGAAQTICLIQ